MKHVLFALLLFTNSLFAAGVAVPPLDKVTCDVTIVKYQTDGTEERISILYSGDDVVI